MLWVYMFTTSIALVLLPQWLVTAIVLLRQFRDRSQTLGQTLAQAFGWLMAIVSTALVYLPWAPTAIAHLQSDGGTSWLSHDIPLYQTVLYPLVQTLAAAVFMLIMLPVEQVPLWVSIPSALVMLGVFGVVLRQFIQGWRQKSEVKTSRLEASRLKASQPTKGAPLGGYSLVVFAIIMLITYGLGKDLTRAPRYFFMLYPAVSVLLAIGLKRRRRWVLTMAIAAGILSQILISYDIALLKPFLPGQIGQRIAAETSPTVVLIAPGQDSYRALSLSYILAIPQSISQPIAQSSTVQVALTEPATPGVWQPKISGSVPKDSVLWLIEPKREIPFPQKAVLPPQMCLPAGEPISTEGTRQQRYRCSATDQSASRSSS